MMESSSPVIRAADVRLLLCVRDLRRAAELADGADPSYAELQRLDHAREFLVTSKRAYYEALERTSGSR